jgi:hypothetical protein
MTDPRKIQIDAAFEVEGSEDTTQLTVQGHVTQNAPLQAWKDSGGNVVARVSEDGGAQATYLDLEVTTEPASPPAGFVRLYIDQATGKLKTKSASA